MLISSGNEVRASRTCDQLNRKVRKSFLNFVFQILSAKNIQYTKVPCLQEVCPEPQLTTIPGRGTNKGKNMSKQATKSKDKKENNKDVHTKDLGL